MKKISFLLVIATLLLGSKAWAQSSETPINNVDGQTIDVSTQMTLLTDEGGLFNGYTAAGDWSVILTASCTTPNHRLRLRLTSVDIDPHDTLFIYDGNSRNAPLLAAINNNNIDAAGQYFVPSDFNTSSCLTVRFKVSGQGSGAGFYIEATCAIPCVTVRPVLHETYLKARNGVVYDTMIMGDRIQVDTNWEYELRHVADSEFLQLDPQTGDSVWRHFFSEVNDTTGFDTVHSHFWGLELCEGDSIILSSHGEYGPGIYTPTDNLSTFYWSWGDGDTNSMAGTSTLGHKYREVGCYDFSLALSDVMGCMGSEVAQVRIRIAIMPIKTIFDLPNICNTDSFLVNVGFDGDGATLTLKPIEFQKTASKTNPVRTFIPDGPQCPELGVCYEAPVEFKEFPTGRRVQSKDDICSICLNYEHTFMGDYSLAIKCPNENEAIIKYGNYSSAKPDGYSVGTSGDRTGFPLRSLDGSPICDSFANPWGDGLEYCWSRNKAYTLQTGEPCSVDSLDCTYPLVPGEAKARKGQNHGATGNYPGVNTPTHRHLSNAYKITENHVFAPLPSYFTNGGGQTPPPFTTATQAPSDHENKTGYYLPDETFEALVGCPLNGRWSMKVCDEWGADNGWIFSWGMDICGISSGGCEYQVGIDSVTWRPDSTYGDFDLGHWRGVTMTPRDSVQTWIATPDTAGKFRIIVSIYDEFGCVWDTATSVRSVWNPMPDLGPDTITLCSDQTLILDATDRTTPFTNQTFAWEPYGDTTATIETHSGLNTSTLYLVEVTNTQHTIRCKNRDSVRVNIYKSPEPNFDPGIYPLEGCEPFTVHFQNNTQFGDTYRWEFGDGATSTAVSPTHTYATGQYGFKFYAMSNSGCQDSLVYEDLITVFPSPVAQFTWEPINPTVLHPEVQFTNMSQPQSDAVKFYWEVQYDRDNPLSYHTMRETSPSFEWYTDGEDISGTYIARLIAKTDERGPSGHILECRDTVENTILLVNDFLQFPSVITANGDGINDVFEIKNLVNGLGYPNNSLAIYNRWGKRVYFKTNISSEEDFWDPAKDNIPAGTYFWRFSGKGYLGNIERNGTVEVLR